MFSKATLAQSQLPEGVRNVGIDQRLDEQLPLDIEFRNEDGRLVTLGEFFNDKPVVLSLVYHECPCCARGAGGCCGLSSPSFDVGKEFEVLTVSFNPRRRALAKTARDLTSSATNVRGLPMAGIS
jgi:cytochrome oxidase Cu insertion factor (SCO1/SenC/PrrC family)